MFVSSGSENQVLHFAAVSSVQAGGVVDSAQSADRPKTNSPNAATEPAEAAKTNPLTAQSRLATETLLAAQGILDSLQAANKPASRSNDPKAGSQEAESQTADGDKEGTEESKTAGNPVDAADAGTKEASDKKADARPEEEKEEDAEGGDSPRKKDDKGSDNLTPEEQQQVVELKQRDAEVKRHEQAHAAVGGQYAGAPVYEYQKGPDGRQYAIGGEVSIDASPLPDPKETIEKLRVVRRATLAPAEPSPQDQRVAAQASQGIAQASADLKIEEREERQERAEAAEEKQEERREERPDSNSPAAGTDNDQPGQTPNRAIQFGENGISSQQAAQAFTRSAELTGFPTPERIDSAELNQIIAQVQA